MGIDSRFIITTGLNPTGTSQVRLDGDGQARFRAQRPAACDDVHLTADDQARLTAWGPDWLYYGALSSMAEKPRLLLARLAESLQRARRLYDVNLRKDSYTPELLAELLAEAEVVKRNEDEMLVLGELFHLPTTGIGQFCQAGAKRYGWETVEVTLGEQGCGIWPGVQS